jgi:hypothetical protein
MYVSLKILPGAVELTYAVVCRPDMGYNVPWFAYEEEEEVR